jgi:RNA polymerase sigma-70 factor (ECF subfamily)
LLVREAADGDDVGLVRAMARGDRDALARLYDRYAPILIAVGVQLLGSRTHGEDLAHDVFLEALKHAGEYDPRRGSVRTWLVMRCRSRAIDRRRAAGWSRAVPLDGERQVEAGGGDEDPALGSDRAAVRRALDELPEEQKRVIELGYFEGLSSSEIAEKLAAPIGTVKSRVAAALAKLRAVLGGKEPQ